MSRELIIAWAGRHRREPWNGLCAELRTRIARHAPVRELMVRARRAAEPSRGQAEAEALLTALPEPCRVVALDRSGKMMSSEELADWLRREREAWPHPIVFLVGSDLGLGESAIARADLLLSLGPLTLPHELARLVLHEQLYRAFAIQRGIKYHRRPF